MCNVDDPNTFNKRYMKKLEVEELTEEQKEEFQSQLQSSKAQYEQCLEVF
jgi:hypothetical protein